MFINLGFINCAIENFQILQKKGQKKKKVGVGEIPKEILEGEDFFIFDQEETASQKFFFYTQCAYQRKDVKKQRSLYRRGALKTVVES